MSSITLQNVTETADALSFTFDLVNLPNGYALNPRPELEALNASGVDGTVYRDKGQQYENFSMRAVKFHTSFTVARDFKNDIERCKSNFMQVVSDEHGTEENILCVSVSTRIVPGEGAGSSIAPGTVAYTVSVFDLVKA